MSFFVVFYFNKNYDIFFFLNQFLNTKFSKIHSVSKSVCLWKKSLRLSDFELLRYIQNDRQTTNIVMVSYFINVAEKINQGSLWRDCFHSPATTCRYILRRYLPLYPSQMTQAHPTEAAWEMYVNQPCRHVQLPTGTTWWSSRHLILLTLGGGWWGGRI